MVREQRWASDFPVRGSMANPASAAGWRELHRALMGGVPYAADIAALLDSSGFGFPAAPAFSAQGAELRCYRVIHRAWRAGVLSELLRLLQFWRGPAGRLSEAARRGEFQQALLGFVCEHRSAGFAALKDCLSQPPPWRVAAVACANSSEAALQRLNALWSDYAGRNAA